MHLNVNVRTLCITISIASTLFIALWFFLLRTHPTHRQISSVLIDAVFSSTLTNESIANELPHDEFVTLAKFCASGPDPVLLRRQFGATGHANMMAVIACMNADASLSNMAKQFSSNDFAGTADLTSVQALLTRLGSLVYGENSAESIRRIVSATVNRPFAFERHEFVDLGCGRSKVLAVACTQQTPGSERFVFEKCHGVEYAHARVAIAQELQQQLQQALRNASEHRLAARLADSIEISRGDVRSAELASRLFPRVSVVYMYNTLFGADLDGAIARLVARHARPGTRVMMHKFHASVWPATEFRVLQTFEADELSWTAMVLLEVLDRQR
jgi:hypothetical protein